MQCDLNNEKETEAAGAALASVCTRPVRIFLHGDLGAGKTTWVRGFLRGLGYVDIVKSPTYTIVESYQIAPFSVHHFDWYRLESPAELESIGIWDYLNEAAHCLIEWPDKGKGLGLQPDLNIYLTHTPVGRHLEVVAATAIGEQLLSKSPNITST